MGAASRYASRCGRRPKATASRARQPVPRCASVTTRLACERIVAVARENNFASRMVLGGIGMTECDGFVQQGHQMVMYQSVRQPACATCCRIALISELMFSLLWLR